MEVTTKEGEPAELTEIKVDDVTVEKTHTMSGTNPLTGEEIKTPIEWTTTETTKTTPYYTLGKDVVVTKKNVSNSTTNFSRSAANSGSGSKSKQANKQDRLEDESDRYHDVDVELKQIANRLEAIQAKTDRKMGASWLENLNEQFALLNDQIAQTDAKLKIAKLIILTSI